MSKKGYKNSKYVKIFGAGNLILWKAIRDFAISLKSESRVHIRTPAKKSPAVAVLFIGAEFRFAADTCRRFIIPRKHSLRPLDSLLWRVRKQYFFGRFSCFIVITFPNPEKRAQRAHGTDIVKTKIGNPVKFDFWVDLDRLELIIVLDFYWLHLLCWETDVQTFTVLSPIKDRIVQED